MPFYRVFPACFGNYATSPVHYDTGIFLKGFPLYLMEDDDRNDV